MAKKQYEAPTYGTVHAMEQGMREAGAGVFAKNAGAAPANKARTAAPDNKAEVSMSMTKPELLKAAKAEGVDVTDDNNKAEIIAKIEKARK